MSKALRKVMAWVLFTCLMMSCVAAAAEAYSVKLNMAEPEDWDEGYDPNKTVVFGLYRIGEPDGTTDSAWKPVEAFKDLLDGMTEKPESGDTWTADQVKAWQDAVCGEIGYDPAGKNADLPDPDYTSASVEYGKSVTVDIDVPGIYMGVAISKPDRLVVNPFTIAVPAVKSDDPQNVEVQVQENEEEVILNKIDYITPAPTAISGEKQWVDDNDFDGMQPKEIQIQLMRSVNGSEPEAFGDPVTISRPSEASGTDGGTEGGSGDGSEGGSGDGTEGGSEGGSGDGTAESTGWKYSFEDLPAEGPNFKENGEPGEYDAYTYSVKEIPIEGYESRPGDPEPGKTESFNIINTHEVKYGALKVKKIGSIPGFAAMTPNEKAYIRNYIKGLKFIFKVTGPIDEEIWKNRTKYPRVNYFEDEPVELTAEIDENGSFSSKEVLFRDKLIPGTYTISEEIVGEHEGMKVRLEEPNDGVVVVEESVNGSYSLEVLNNPQEMGCLNIKKTLKVNNVVNTTETASGEFTFELKRKGEDGKYTLLREVTVKIVNGNTETVKVENLLPGDYIVTEKASTVPGMELLTKNDVEVTVSAGETATVPTAEFENNKGVGGLKITKSVTSNGSASAADGTYEFTVTGPNGYKKTVKITIKDGKSSTYLLNDLVPGEYTIKEDKSKLGERVTLKTPSDNVRKCTVKAGVVADASNAPEAAFLNEYRTPPPGGGGGNPTPTPSPTPTPTPTPTPAVNMNGQKRWDDESDVHKVRPSTITIRLYADGVEKDSITVSGSSNTWTYDFGTLPAVDEYGNNITYTVLEDDVSGYTTTYDGRTIINDLIEQPPKEYTNITGNKVWIDNNNENGNRPNYIVVRLMRDGVEVERRTVTAANGWQFSFNDMPKDDGYGHIYTYTLREDPVPGYFNRVSGTRLINTELPPPPDRVPTLNNPSEEDMEDLLDLFGYDTPLFGELLGTGDITPLYPFIFGGVGGLALITLVVLLVVGKKKRKNAA